MKRTALYYFFMVTALGLGIFFILRAGNQLPAPALPLSTQSSSQITPHLTGAGDYSFSAAVESSLWDNANDPLSRLFLQLFNQSRNSLLQVEKLAQSRSIGLIANFLN